MVDCRSMKTLLKKRLSEKVEVRELTLDKLDKALMMMMLCSLHFNSLTIL